MFPTNILRENLLTSRQAYRDKRPMKKIDVYTTIRCGYCVMAKRLLDSLELSYEEIDVSYDAEKRHWLVESTGQRTVPQIFIGDQAIGGYTELAALNRSGELDALVRGD